MGRMSTAVNDLADVFEAIEAGEKEGRGYDITDLSPRNEDILRDGKVKFEFTAQIPFLDPDAPSDRMTLKPEDIRLTDDGALEIEIAASVEPADCSKTESDPTPEEDTVPRGEGQSETAEAASSLSSDSATLNQSRPDTGTTDENEGDHPAYRDPDQLEAVYDEYDTFAAMTEALDVGVTSQTVRRYMIKHGVHEPASETGSRAAETLLNVDPASVSPTVHDELDADESPDKSGQVSAKESGSETESATDSAHSEALLSRTAESPDNETING